MSELLSYNNILKDISNFKSSGTYNGTEFNIYDTPSHKYFKILFYFGSNSEFGENDGSGLLAPTWELISKAESVLADEERTDEQEDEAINTIASISNGTFGYYNFNSAWAFLKMNNENERAEKLEHFVTLLSDINTNSPWYFNSLSGVQEALERKFTVDGKLDMSEQKKLTITCLPDAFDNRISTLLELYRDITWSWAHKREVIPANLRKFDMAVYIFETPETKWHEDSVDGEVIIGGSTGFKTSYKMIEFHDCEINYNSIKSGWGDMNNQTGFTPTYQIEISYADCYEVSYNDIMMRKIGDVILTDLINNTKNDSDYESIAQTNDNTLAAEISIRTKPYDHGFFGNILMQGAGHLKAGVTGFINQKLMGNIFGFSLTNFANQAGELLKGNVIKTGMSIGQYVKEQKNSKRNINGDPKRNLYEDFVPQQKVTSISLGNIFSKNTIANNI